MMITQNMGMYNIVSDNKKISHSLLRATYSHFSRQNVNICYDLFLDYYTINLLITRFFYINVTF